MDYADDDLALGIGYPDQADQLYLIKPLPPAEFRLDYGNDWIAFAEEVLKIQRTPEQIRLGLPWYTPDQKRAADTILSRKYTLVLSGNMVGKTFLMAILVLLFYYRGFTIITTAPTMRQVHQIWAEIRSRKMHAERISGRALPGDWKPSEEHVKDMNEPKHALYGFAAQVGAGEAVATSFQGKHHVKMGVFVDEGIGVQKAVFDAIDTVVGNEWPDGVVAVFGNPTEEGSHAHTLETIKHDDPTQPNYGEPVWTTVEISGENHPNVVYDNAKIIPGAVTRSFINLQRAKGGGVHSAYYRTSVLGKWPGQKKDALILADWIEKSMRRSELRMEDDRNGIERVRDARGVALGLDVAGQGDNLTVLTACEDYKLFWPKLTRPCWHVGLDHQSAVDLLICAIKEIPRVLSISIDDTGAGAEVSATLWRRRNEFPNVPIYITKGPRADPSAIWQKLSITRINFGASPIDDFDQERLARMRDVLWWKLREDLRERICLLPTAAECREVGFPPECDLKAQIMNPIQHKDDRGKIHVVDKSTVKDVPKAIAQKLPNISPDLAHSAMLAWWAWRELPERQAAPRTTEQHFETQFRAQVAATINQTRRDDGLTPTNMPAIFRRAR